MSEAMIGYLEALFVVTGLVFILAVWVRTFRPSARRQMEEHGRIPFREDQPGCSEARDGTA